MSTSSIRTSVIHKGKRPPCLKSQQQCRGCFGWRNMLRAAQNDILWQSYPFRCSLTGLTLKIIDHQQSWGPEEDPSKGPAGGR